MGRPLDTTIDFRIDFSALKDEKPFPVSERIELKRNDECLWRKEPREDLIAIDISSKFASPDVADLRLHVAGPADLVRPDSYDWHQIAPGENVLVFGHPAGLAVADTSQPVVSQGHLATPIFQPQRAVQNVPGWALENVPARAS